MSLSNHVMKFVTELVLLLFGLENSLTIILHQTHITSRSRHSWVVITFESANVAWFGDRSKQVDLL